MHIVNISISAIERKIVLILIFFLHFLSLGAQNSGNLEYHLRTVVIDPGHGGKDPGSVGTKTCEKDVVLAIALKLGNYIETKFNDVKVIYTRKTDEFIPLYKRAEIANNSKADLFISIHANGLTRKDVDGTETLVLGLHRAEENFEVAKKENSVILLEEDYSARYEGFNPESPESYIMLTLMQSIYFDHSINFAKNVQDQFRDRARRKDRGVKQQGLLVLAQTSMPGVLIETGFVTNPEEERYLMSEEGQDYIASAIFRAFRDYKHFIESRSIAAAGIIKENTVTDSATVITTMDTVDAKETAEVVENKSVKKSHSETGKNEKGIEFKVQVAVSGKRIPLDSDFFKEITDVYEFKENNYYKYAVGSKKTYNEIVEYSKWVKNKFPDAFVIALKNGKVIPMEQALKLTTTDNN
ncbi:MAG: N-acetylmuramoyl-L-alanine amidase [Bacteroidales bacterium]|nr:N-acetylmuramoyl-L-alanine amidase [Bacteroidales bacterium]